MAIDSHMHLNSLVSNNISDDINKINIDSSLQQLINVGLNFSTSKESVEIANNNKKFFSSIGIHPLYIERENLSNLYKLLDSKKIVAVGEIGMDAIQNN